MRCSTLELARKMSVGIETMNGVERQQIRRPAILSDAAADDFSRPAAR